MAQRDERAPGNYARATKDQCFHERRSSLCLFWNTLPDGVLQRWATPEARKMIDTQPGAFYTDAAGVHWRRTTAAGTFERYVSPSDGAHTYDSMSRGELAARICHLERTPSE